MLPQQRFYYYFFFFEKRWASRATGDSLLPTFCQFPVTFLYSSSPYPHLTLHLRRTHAADVPLVQTSFPLLLAKIRVVLDIIVR